MLNSHSFLTGMSLLHFMAFHWLSPVCLCLSCPGGSRTGHSTPHVASAVLSRGEGSLQPIGNACLMQPKIQLASFLACQGHFSGCSTHCWPGPFLWLFYSWDSPHHVLVHGFLLPGRQSDILWNFMDLMNGPVSPFLQPVQVPLDDNTTL